jgi:hypothetical protein
MFFKIFCFYILYWHCQNVHCNISKYITHSTIYFTTYYMINTTYDCSVQINTIPFTFLFTLVKISHSTIAITLQYTKYLECTQYCNIFSVLYTYILKKQFYDQNIITNSKVIHLSPQSAWWQSIISLNFGYSIQKYNLLFNHVSAAKLNFCLLLENVKFLKYCNQKMFINSLAH